MSSTNGKKSGLFTCNNNCRMVASRIQRQDKGKEIYIKICTYLYMCAHMYMYGYL